MAMGGSQCCSDLGLIGVRWLQLASARAEQERLQSEARRMRDAAHEQQLTVMRQSLSAAKVCLLPCLSVLQCLSSIGSAGQLPSPGGSTTDDEASRMPAQLPV